MKKIIILIGIALILISFIVAYNSIKPTGKFIYSENLEVSVNGEKITSEDVENIYAKIPDIQKEETTKEEILNDLINQKLLLQEARKNGIEVTEQEVESYLGQLKSFNGLNEDELEEQIKITGFTIDEYRNNLKDAITISKLLNQELDLQKIVVSDSEVESVLNGNGDLEELLPEDDLEFENALRDRIKQKLILDRQKELVSNYVESLRARAQIEVRGGIVSE